MSGISEGNIYSGIGRGIEQATSNILNLYGLKQRFDLQQQGLAIDKQNADTKQKRMHYTLASRFEREEGKPQMRTLPAQPGTRQPGRMNFGLPAQLETDPRYLAGADALSPDFTR